jgi:hypothetical protein
MQGLQCFRKQCLQGLIGQDLLCGGGQGLQRTIYRAEFISGVWQCGTTFFLFIFFLAIS